MLIYFLGTEIVCKILECIFVVSEVQCVIFVLYCEETNGSKNDLRFKEGVATHTLRSLLNERRRCWY